jgi:hypothetical protein
LIRQIQRGRQFLQKSSVAVDRGEQRMGLDLACASGAGEFG